MYGKLKNTIANLWNFRRIFYFSRLINHLIIILDTEPPWIVQAPTAGHWQMSVTVWKWLLRRRITFRLAAFHKLLWITFDSLEIWSMEKLMLRETEQLFLIYQSNYKSKYCKLMQLITSKKCNSKDFIEITCSVIFFLFERE